MTPEDYLIKLRVFDVKRADSGDYTLTADNRNGRDTYTVRVNVMGELTRIGARRDALSAERYLSSAPTVV